VPIHDPGDRHLAVDLLAVLIAENLKQLSATAAYPDQLWRALSHPALF
jgi:hypothetical protein